MSNLARSLAYWIVFSFILAAAVPNGSAEEPDFARDVAPVFNSYCVGCHNEQDREGELSLTSYEHLLAGGSNGPSLVAGDLEASLLAFVLRPNDELVMPPEGEPRPSEEQIAKVIAWISAGAPAPKEVASPLRLDVPDVPSQVEVEPATSIAFSPDGAWVAVGRFERVDLYRWNGSVAVLAEAPTRSLGPLPGQVLSVDFSSDSGRLAVASGVAGLGGATSVWSVDDGALVAEFTGHADIVYDAAFSPAGDLLATCSYDRAINLWDVATGALVRTLSGHNGPVFDVAFSPDGRFLASASGDDTCKVWRVADGERLDTLSQPLKESYSVAFTPDGAAIVSVGADQKIRVWDFVSTEGPKINPQRIAQFAHDAPIVAMAISTDGRRLVTAAEDHTLKLWDAGSWRQLHAWDESDRDVVASLAFAPDGGVLIARLDGAIDWRETESFSLSDRGSGSERAAAHPAPGGETTKAAEQEPNDVWSSPQIVAAPARITGVIGNDDNAAVDVDWYRFHAAAGEEWVIEVDAARSGSPLDSFVEVRTPDGEKLPRVVLQAVRESYFTFRGKDANQSDDFRVFNWEEMKLDEFFYAGGEVTKLWRYPRGPDSGFRVYPGVGSRWGYFDTTPLAHALGEPAYVVRAYTPGAEPPANGLPAFTIYYENDDASDRGAGVDSRLLFTAPADGDYLVRVKDVRGFESADFAYQLAIRPRRPGFRAQLTTKKLSVPAGGGAEYGVSVERSDGFTGQIEVQLENLPEGYSTKGPVVVEAEQLEAFGVIMATSDAASATPEQLAEVSLVASAEGEVLNETLAAAPLEGLEVTQDSRLKIEIVSAPDGRQPRRGPNGESIYSMHPGETMRLMVRVGRGEFDGRIEFGGDDSGRNLPYGAYVDNIGLNGLLIPEGQSEREFFVTADPVTKPQTRWFHLKTDSGGASVSEPVQIEIVE